VVIKKSEEAIESNIERAWLKQSHFEWLKSNLAGFDTGADIAI
jgi:hypothetical protein